MGALLTAPSHPHAAAMEGGPSLPGLQDQNFSLPLILHPVCDGLEEPGWFWDVAPALTLAATRGVWGGGPTLV